MSYIESFVERFFDCIHEDTDSDCWLWVGGLDSYGYGQIRFNGPKRLAHRLSWELFRGPIGDKYVLHDCDTPCCVNPDCLHLGTQQDNVRERDLRNRRTALKGEEAGRAKLNNEQVLKIRKSVKPKKDLANAFGISISQITNILSRKSWAHL